MERRKKKRKIFAEVNKRRLVISLTVVIILGILIYNIPVIYEFFVYSDFQKVEGLFGNEYQMERCGDDMLAYNNKEMVLINTKGDAKWSVAVSTTFPKVYVEDDYILLADLKGKKAYLYDEDTLLAEIEQKDGIYAAALDNDGNVAIVSRKQGYKGLVTVYNDDGEAKYSFKSGGGYIGAVDIRKDCFVVSQIDVSEKGVNSKIILMDWEDNEEKFSLIRKDSMVFDVRFQSNGDIIAVSDKDFIGCDDGGDVDFTVSFNGRQLEKYNIQSDDNMVFCFSGDRNDTVIESYSKSGKLRGKRNENGDISNIDTCGESIISNSMRELTVMDPDGDKEDPVVSGHDVRKIKLFSNRRFVFVTGNSEATIVKVKR